MFRVLFPILIYLSILTPLAQAADAPVRCYKFKTATAEVTHASATGTGIETWCYQKINYPAGATYIYNNDSAKVKIELALVVESNGYITHASLLAGKLTTHRIHSKYFNPFSLPLKEPRSLPLAMEGLSTSKERSAREALSYLLGTAPRNSAMSLDVGSFEVQAAALPWRSYWFPQKGQTMGPALKKYDLFVKAREGKSPEAARYERRYHGWGGEVWEGHCNGWAAASILRAEPQHARFDPISNVSFSVLDQKAFLIEKDYCSVDAFFGSRFREETDNLYDVRPAVFHKAITYYIGELGKPVAMDYNREATVDNNVMSGYKMEVTKIGSRTYSVKTIATIHKYDKKRSEYPGIAPVYLKTYKYTLRTDEAGNIIGGSWRSGNPDFLWVPLSSRSCPNNNQKVSEAYVQEILNL